MAAVGSSRRDGPIPYTAIAILYVCAMIFTAVHMLTAEDTYKAGQPTCQYRSSFSGLISSGFTAITMISKGYFHHAVLHKLLLEVGWSAVKTLLAHACRMFNQSWKDDLPTVKTQLELDAVGAIHGCYCALSSLRLAQQHGTASTWLVKGTYGLPLAWCAMIAAEAWVMGTDIMSTSHRDSAYA